MAEHEAEIGTKDFSGWHTRIAAGESVWIDETELRLLKVKEHDCEIDKIEEPQRTNITVTYDEIFFVHECQTHCFPATRHGTNLVEFVVKAPKSVKLSTSLLNRGNAKISHR